MSYHDILTSPEPEPGEALDELDKDLTEREVSPAGISDPVTTLSEQEDLANKRLDYYLRNLSDTPGAQKVVEEFYEEEHGKDIDASDVSELREEVPNLEAIISERALPAVTKGELRGKYGVEGSWKADPESHLTPEWVIEGEHEPYLINETGGTTGEPWHRSMTRNDISLFISGIVDALSHVLEEADAEFKELSLLVPSPNWYWFSERYPSVHQLIADYTGIEIKHINFQKLRPGKGDIADAAIDYINNADFSVVLGPTEYLMYGKIGVSIRRGDADIDAVINAASSPSEEVLRVFEEQDTSLYDYYGETEYPQRSQLSNGTDRFKLPLTSQVNLVLDEETGELSYEGRGRFSYFSFGVDGQIIPGVYVSGVKGTLEKTEDGGQMLLDVEREQTDQGRCADPN